MAKKSALGKGLGALIENENYSSGSAQGKKPAPDNYMEIPLAAIEANPFQPRVEFDDEALNELAESIKRLGIIQPITVKKPDNADSEKYQLISGERRLRAAKLANLQNIPAFVRKADDQGLLELALVENIQREDLNSIEVAITYKRLMEECELTQDNLSRRVGKKRTTITNYLRLLKLPPEVQVGIRDKKISMGHARALINIEEADKQQELFHRIMREGLSVRKVEELVRNINKPAPEKEKPAAPELPVKHRQLTNALKHSLDRNIEVKRNNRGKGKLVIPFQSDEDFELLMNLMEKIKS